MAGPIGLSAFVGGSFTARDHIASDPNRIAVPIRTQRFVSVVARPKGHAYIMREALILSGTGETAIHTWRNES